MRVYWCPRCRRLSRSLEWPEALLARRFELLRKEVQHERQRLRQRAGGKAIDKCLTVLKTAQYDLERAKEAVQTALDCGHAEPEYNVQLVDAYSPTNVL